MALSKLCKALRIKPGLPTNRMTGLCWVTIAFRAVRLTAAGAGQRELFHHARTQTALGHRTHLLLFPGKAQLDASIISVAERDNGHDARLGIIAGPAPRPCVRDNS